MGRPTLNMLLSFAQFEREVTGERIRDKIAASKMKGMWMGGAVPLGYEPDGRTLAINKAEAETVCTLFRLYREHGNVRRVKAEADRLGLGTKVRHDADGKRRGGCPLSRGHIYRLLGNPLYVGRIAHKEKTYEGQHPAIVDEETWEAVQAMLAGNARAASSTARSTDPSPLMGKLFDDTGAPLTPSHAVKSGRRYRYYVSRRLVDGTVADGGKGWRLPAREIKRTAVEAVRGLLADRSVLTRTARNSGMPADRISGLLDAVSRWTGQNLDLVERVNLASEWLTFSLDLSPIADEPDMVLRHAVPTRIRRRGVETELVLDGNGTAPAAPDPALIKAVVRAHRWFDDLIAGRARSLGEIAKREGISDRYVGHLMPLAFLAPDIVEAILNGTQLLDLTAETLTKRTGLPLGWPEQKVLFGFE